MANIDSIEAVAFSIIEDHGRLLSLFQKIDQQITAVNYHYNPESALWQLSVGGYETRSPLLSEAISHALALLER